MLHAIAILSYENDSKRHYFCLSVTSKIQNMTSLTHLLNYIGQNRMQSESHATCRTVRAGLYSEHTGHNSERVLT